MEAQAVVAEAPGRVVFKAVPVPEPTAEDFEMILARREPFLGVILGWE